MSHDAESVRSPLHRLQAEIAKDPALRELPTSHRTRHEPVFDNESVYSFDSVSTLGRLLDRLDLDDEYAYDEELRRRELFMLMQSTGRLLDRLGLEDNDDVAPPENKFRPIRANSAISLDRMRSVHAAPPARSLSSAGKMPVKSAAHKVMLQRGNYSVDSLHADLVHNGLLALLPSADLLCSSTPPLRHLSQKASKAPLSSPIPESHQPFELPTRSATALPTPPLRRNTSGSSVALNTSALPGTPLASRSFSSSSNGSSASLETPLFNPNAKFAPAVEALTKKALSLRLQGNHREASYQLQTLANVPTNYPKAMYWYAKALRLGLGVKLNEGQAVRWLCRCILVSFILEGAAVEPASLSNYVAKFADLGPDSMVSLVKRNLGSPKLDPFDLHDHFATFTAMALKKILELNARDALTTGGAYFLVGDSLLLGQGVQAKDEELGRLFMAKAASLGYSEAAVKLGELWCNKTKNFKKDVRMAAAWLRLGELLGKKDIGNSWIYKDKYMERRKK